MLRYILFFFVCIVIFSSCSRNEPRIPFGTIELVYVQGEGERFSFFVMAEDDDGIDNLDSLYLYHDREGLSWKLTHEDWITVEEEEVTWIGSRNISMVGGGALPRGQFRAVLTNKGGERSERMLVFDVPQTPRHPFPGFTIQGGRYTITSQYSEHFLLAYDDMGNFIRFLQVDSLQGDILNLGLGSNVRALALWASDSEFRTSALTDIRPLN